MAQEKKQSRERRPRRKRSEARPQVETRERDERDFEREIRMRVRYFLQSDEDELELEPMNSFRRRVVHNAAKEWHLHSESRGDERDRHVVLIKTDETPPASALEDEEPAEDEAPPEAVEAEAPPPRSERGPRSSRGERPRERSGGRSEGGGGRSGGRLPDYGSQDFPVNPGSEGIHLALKDDGSLEIFRESDRPHIVSDRIVTAGPVRVRQGQILQPGDAGY